MASRWKQPEIIFAIWGILVLASLYPVTKYLDGAFPIFTVTWAIAIQALLFTVPNLLATFVLPPLQSVLYVFVYSFLAVGVIGGWAASRTNSIWPSLFSVTVLNFVFVVLMV